LAQSLAKVLVHMTFSTKDRTPCLVAPVRAALHEYMAGILRRLDSPAIIIESVADHVHILFHLSKNVAVSKTAEEVKKATSSWLKTQHATLRGFHWQNGYAAFSVSQSNAASVKRYIRGQAEHHRKRTYQDELRLLLQRHAIEYDEHYLWS